MTTTVDKLRKESDEIILLMVGVIMIAAVILYVAYSSRKTYVIRPMREGRSGKSLAGYSALNVRIEEDVERGRQGGMFGTSPSQG